MFERARGLDLQGLRDPCKWRWDEVGDPLNSLAYCTFEKALPTKKSCIRSLDESDSKFLNRMVIVIKSYSDS
jgi:hypothetical protein